jgi:hypothetical protein
LNASTRSCLAFADVCPSSLCVAKNPKNHTYNYKQTFFDTCYVRVQGLGWLHNPQHTHKGQKQGRPWPCFSVPVPISSRHPISATTMQV